jgi:3-hydroxyisobutyrate dehydrogenase
MIKYRGPFVLDQPDEAWFDCKMMQKDMLLALEAGREYGVSMPTTAASNELLSAARGLGIDHYDFAVVFDVLAAMAGVKGSVA